MVKLFEQNIKVFNYIHLYLHFRLHSIKTTKIQNLLTAALNEVNLQIST